MMQKHTIPTLARALSAPRRAQGRVTCLFWAVMTTLLWPLLAASDPAAQTLSEALCPTPPPYDFILEPPLTPWVPGMAGIPMLKRTLNDAVCNDGSAAMMYIRPAHAAFAGNPIGTPSRKWIIFFDGGASCRDADSCLLERWCHGGGQVFDRAGKMSSLGADDAIQGHGLFDILPGGPGSPLVNAFRDYNHVLVHYCSSDNWIGSQSHQGLQTSTGTTFDIAFQGEAIVNAVFSTLLAGPTAADPVPAATYYATPLPNLATADTILLAGESAGGGGLRHHLDRLHFDVLQPALLNPDATIRGLIDAGAPPHLGGPNIDWPDADPDAPASYSDYLETEMAATVRDFWGVDDAALDQSCLDPVWEAAHDLAGGHPQVCYDTTYTLLNHITTPVFLREDINDPLGKQRYQEWQLYASNDAYWADVYAQLQRFAGYSATRGGLEPPLGPPGILGINCNQHVAVQTLNGFFRHRVTGSGVPPRTFHSLLYAWLVSGYASPQIQVDTLGVGLYTPSFCP